MEANKILQSDILDLVFEGRNKDYGAYELRRKYNRRITLALVITAALAAAAVLGTVLANTLKTSDEGDYHFQHC
jgi:periplasmic protein TonB